MKQPNPRIIMGQRTFSVSFGGMTWPYPLEELEHHLRYGTYTQQDAMAAAGIVAAYAQMISDPASKRQKVVANIRHALGRISGTGRATKGEGEP